MIEDIKLFVAAHKAECGGAVLLAAGIFLILGSLMRWAWLTEIGSTEYQNMGLISAALYQKFGTRWLRIRNILLGLVLSGAGLVILLLLKH